MWALQCFVFSIILEYLTIAIAHVLKEATRGQQPAARMLILAAFLFMNSMDTIDGHVHYSKLPICNLLANPQKFHAAKWRAW
jgi:hypothetical protein